MERVLERGVEAFAEAEFNLMLLMTFEKFFLFLFCIKTGM